MQNQTETRDSQETEPVIEAKITCDNCRRSEELEKFNGQSSWRVPPGWIQVKPQVLRHRDDPEGLLAEMKASEINDKISKMVPIIHICTECLVDRDTMLARRREKEEEKRKKEEAKIKAAEEKANKAVVEVTRVTSGRRLITEGDECQT